MLLEQAKGIIKNKTPKVETSFILSLYEIPSEMKMDLNMDMLEM